MKALVIDDEKKGRETYRMLLEERNFSTDTASSAREARQLFCTNTYQIILCDIMMPEESGVTLLTDIKRMFGSRTEVIMITGYATVETAVQAIKNGAFGYFIKGNNPEELILEIDKAVKNINDNNDTAGQTAGKTKEEMDYVITSNNPAMKEIWKMVDIVAPSNANVLITGESGTGKEIVAKQIHKLSRRKQRQFIAINCSQYSSSLIESELFGHEKGAFTGALAARTGKLEEADGGTVFLDEIGDVSMDVQVKLLRVLENHQIEKVGSNVKIPVDFRLITATNKSLKKKIAENDFREDFFFRINTIEIKLPPLRERREDIPLLVDYFVKKYAGEIGLPKKEIEQRTMRYLMNYEYRGNIRELKNMIERMMILSYDSISYVIREDMMDNINPESKEELLTYREAKKNFEYEYIVDVLRKSDRNTLTASEKMGISRRQLTNKMNELGIILADI